MSTMERTKLQKKAAEALFEHKRLLCQWSTGTGKTGIALEYIKAHPNCRCLILVPEKNNIDNWIAEFEKFGVGMWNVTIICYASMHKHQFSNWDLIVYDEVPHLNTEKKIKIAQSISTERVLALGAHLTDEQREALRLIYGPFVVSTISLETSIEHGFLPTPEVIVCHMDIEDIPKKFRHKGKLLSAREYYEMLCDKIRWAVDNYNERSTPQNKRRMLSYGVERKRFLGELKTNAMDLLCEKLQQENKRYICFCSSVAQAQRLGGNHAYTSKTPKCNDVLRRFNEHQIDSIYVVGKLIEGQNLNDIECGVICQMGGTARITIQEIGRVLRGKQPKVYVTIFDNTKDDCFLGILTNNIPSNYIKHCKFNQI